MESRTDFFEYRCKSFKKDEVINGVKFNRKREEENIKSEKGGDSED